MTPGQLAYPANASFKFGQRTLQYSSEVVIWLALEYGSLVEVCEGLQPDYPTMQAMKQARPEIVANVVWLVCEAQ